MTSPADRAVAVLRAVHGLSTDMPGRLQNDSDPLLAKRQAQRHARLPAHGLCTVRARRRCHWGGLHLRLPPAGEMGGHLLHQDRPAGELPAHRLGQRHPADQGRQCHVRRLRHAAQAGRVTRCRAGPVSAGSGGRGAHCQPGWRGCRSDPINRHAAGGYLPGQDRQLG